MYSLNLTSIIFLKRTNPKHALLDSCGRSLHSINLNLRLLTLELEWLTFGTALDLRKSSVTQQALPVSKADLTMINAVCLRINPPAPKVLRRFIGLCLQSVSIVSIQ